MERIVVNIGGLLTGQDGYRGTVLPLTLNLYAEEILPPLEKNSLTGLTWDECVKIAKENHPDLVSAGEKLNQAKADKAITTSNLLPLKGKLA